MNIKIIKNCIEYTIKNKKLNEGTASVSRDKTASLTDGTLYIPSSVEDNGIKYTVTKIADEAFVDWKELKRVYIPVTVTHIGRAAFLGCSNLIETNFLKNVSSVEHIEDRAFGDCSQLRKSAIISSVQSIGKEAFGGCEKLEEAFISNEIEVIPENAFRGCTNLKSMTLGNKVRIIDELAFFECRELRNVTIPASVEIIGKEAFSKCNKLERVVFLGNPLKLASGVFGNNTQIYYRAGTSGWTTPWYGYITNKIVF